MNVGMTITPPIVPMSHPKSIPPKQALRCQQKFFSFLTCSLAETYRSPKSTFKIASCGFHESRFKYLKLSKLFTPAIKVTLHRYVPEQAKANTRHLLSVSTTPIFCLHPQTVYLWRVPLKKPSVKSLGTFLDTHFFIASFFTTRCKNLAPSPIFAIRYT
jgi:hypothetical protein